MKITEQQTRAIIDAATAEARRMGKSISVAVVDAGGYMLGLLRMEGCGFLSPQIAEAKAFSAAAMRRSIADIAERARQRPETWNAFTNIGRTKLIPGLGGLPIRVNDEVVGAVGVSGATAEEDEAICQAAIVTVTKS
ncbi:MAG: heme-binding protein [Alphaproteobacteria bacterium]|nr:heme-binding protein [Alphaproteobacteria bacterium]